jgi:hypothetical protein
MSGLSRAIRGRYGERNYEDERIGVLQPSHRFRQSMSLAVSSSVTASAICASRFEGERSVLRRSWPKFESHELVRSTGHRGPIGAWTGGRFRPRLLSRRWRAQITSLSPNA